MAAVGTNGRDRRKVIQRLSQANEVRQADVWITSDF